MVDRGYSVSEVKDHPAMKDPSPDAAALNDKCVGRYIRTVLFQTYVMSNIRAVHIRHSCAPNSVLIFSGNLKVTTAVADRDIKAGEEICVAFHASWLRTPEEIGQILLFRFGIVCPISCPCRDPEAIAKVQEAKSGIGAAVKFSGEGKFREAFEAAKELIKQFENNNTGWLQIWQIKLVKSSIFAC